MIVLQHNIQSMFANRQLGLTSMNKAKSTEKLASGYRINKAADDAAGLAISEKMRSQVRGLSRAAENIQDGISLCNTADGALTEVHAMIHRMRELAVQSSNDTNNQEDRDAIDKEVQQLKSEIDRIGEVTEFNKKKVFKGSATAVSNYKPTTDSPFFQIMGGNASQTGYMQEPLPKAKLKTLENTGMHDNGDNDYVSVHADFGSIVGGGNVKQLVGTSFYTNCCTNCCPGKIEFSDESGIKQNGNTVTIGVKDENGNYYSDATKFVSDIVKAGKEGKFDFGHVEFAASGSTLYMYDIDNNNWSSNSKEKAIFADVPKNFDNEAYEEGDEWLQVGANAGQGIMISFGKLSCNTLGIAGGSCQTWLGSQMLLSDSDTAISEVSRMRSRIGAYTNRLEYAYKANEVAKENLQDAESRIRDTDMAEEMSRYSKDSVLEQAGVNMLANANRQNESFLQMLNQG